MIFLPNFIWQIINHFPVFHHFRELYDTQLVHVDRIGFLADQFMMPFFVSLITIPGLVYLLASKSTKKYRFVGIIILLIIITLWLLRAKSYYTIGVFPVLIAAGTVYYELKIKNLAIRYGSIIFFGILSIPLLPMALPISNTQGMVRYFGQIEQKYGIVTGRRFEDGTIHSLPQDYADMIGWEELTLVASKAYQKAENPQKTIIFCNNYGQAGAI